MTPEEIRQLLSVMPPHHQLTYEVAFCTGLRAKELRSLTTGHLDARAGGLVLDPEWTKNRKPGFQPLPGDLVKRLLRSVERGETLRVYRKVHRRKDAKKSSIPENPLLYVADNTSRNLDTYLEKAGIPKLTPAGKLDFHACRVAYATLVIESGANVKEAQALLRHSTPALTMNTYARARSERTREIAERVGERVLFGTDTPAIQRAQYGVGTPSELVGCAEKAGPSIPPASTIRKANGANGLGAMGLCAFM